MALLATSSLAALIPLLLILACPLMMVFMMRGMHGGHGRHAGGEPHAPRDRMTLDELKHERDELNEEIGRRAEETVERRRSKVLG